VVLLAFALMLLPSKAARAASDDGRVIGHGVENNGTIYCCVHCARQGGITGLKDRA
jgi:hypothetical protein